MFEFLARRGFGGFVLVFFVAVDLIEIAAQRTPRSIPLFSASAPLHHSLSSADFITDMSESEFSAHTTEEREARTRMHALLPPHTLKSG